MSRDPQLLAGFKIGRLAMGCAPLGLVDMGSVDLVEARKTVREAFDLGVTVFDTADVYGLGRAEEELSSALGRHRHEALIITKFGVRWETPADGDREGRTRTYRDCSPNYMVKALENSLRRLRLEAIPLYFVHWPDGETPLEAVIEALEQARSDGKIISYGLSNFDLEEISTASQMGTIAAVQDSFSLIEEQRSHDFYRRLRQLGITSFTYGPLAQGLLSGKFTPDSVFGDNDRRARLPQFDEHQWQKNRGILEAVNRLACERGVPMAQVAIRWVLDAGFVDVAVVGAKSSAQLQANMGAMSWTLDQGELDMLNAAYDKRKSVQSGG